MAKIIGNLVGPPNPQIDIETKLSEPRNVINLSNGYSIGINGDGIYLSGVVDEELGIVDIIHLYNPFSGIEAFWASEAVFAQNALNDGEDNVIHETYAKKLEIEELDESAAEDLYISDGYIVSFGVINTSIIASLPESSKKIGFTSALYFATPSVIPENYSYFPDDIYFDGDSVVDGRFVPEANMRYTVVFDFDGFMMNGYVKGVTTV